MKILNGGIRPSIIFFIMDTSHKYQFEVSLFGELFDDIGAFTVIRCPISHTSSYAILNIELRGLVYLTLTTEIENGDFPELSIKCELLDMLKNKEPHLVGTPIETLFTKQYRVLKATTVEYPTPNSTYINCTLVLVNPILYYLNNTNSYNKILLGKTGLELLEDYENHLKSLFGNSFEFIKIGNSVQKNNHSYEQVLIRLENDLIIPSWIIAEYKPNFTYSFYFFDDFRIDESSKKDITAYFINLGAKDEFKKKSTLVDADDIFMGNTFVKSYQIGDPFNEISYDNPSIIVKNSEFAFKYKKAKGSTSIPNVNQSANAIPIDKRRISAVTVASPTKKVVDPTEESLMYAPDNFSNSKKRLEQNSQLIKDDLSGIASFMLKDSHFDFIQFGKIYILNPFESKEFRYTPIGIVNNFIRESGQFPYLIHHCKYQTIKFKASKDWA